MGAFNVGMKVKMQPHVPAKIYVDAVGTIVRVLDDGTSRVSVNWAISKYTTVRRWHKETELEEWVQP